MQKRYILFDLDGTLTNSKEGITKSVQYALQYFGLDVPDADSLECYIGPPLDESFMNYGGLSEKQTVIAMKKYRERYSVTGLYENEVYSGIEECLKELKAEGRVLALATCKPEVFAVKILKHFNLFKYFDVTVGAGFDGIRKHKKDVINEVFKRIMYDEALINQCNVDINEIKADSIMIGDRKEDIIGAKQCNIESVGVRYGFAKQGELEDACADYIVDSAIDIVKLILN